MSIYERLVEVRKQVESMYAADDENRLSLVKVLIQLVEYAFLNNDQFPQYFTLKVTPPNDVAETLKVFLENEVGLTIKKIQDKGRFLCGKFYYIKLI